MSWNPAQASRFAVLDVDEPVPLVIWMAGHKGDDGLCGFSNGSTPRPCQSLSATDAEAMFHWGQDLLKEVSVGEP